MMESTILINQCDPKASYLSHEVEIDEAIKSALLSGSYILGQNVSLFEKDFASYIGVNYGLGVSSGTDALELALRAIGVGNSDIVATVSHTAVATVSAIRRAGASPTFVDIDKNTFTMSPESLQSVIDNVDIKAIIVVHIYGQMADMHSILKIAKKHNIKVVEDCAQAHGAAIEDKKAGSWGDIGCFSCYPTKNLGAIGDAGIVVTNSSSLISKLKVLREYGWKERYISDVNGINSRLDEIQTDYLKRLKDFKDQEQNKKLSILDIEEKKRELDIKCKELEEKVLTNQVYRLSKLIGGKDIACAEDFYPSLRLTFVIWFGSLSLIIAGTGSLLAMGGLVLLDPPQKTKNSPVPFSRALRRLFVAYRKKLIKPKIITEKVEVVKEVPIEVIKEVPVDKIVFKDVPKEIIRKEIVHVPLYTNDKRLLNEEELDKSKVKKSKVKEDPMDKNNAK